MLVALLYTHNWAVFLLPAPVIGAILAAPGARQRVAALSMGSVVAAFLVYLPWYGKAKASSEAGVGDWIVSYWTNSSLALAIPRSLECFGFGSTFPSYMGYLAADANLFLRSLSILVTVLCLSLALFFTIRGRLERRSRTLWAFALVPLLAGVVYSVVFQPVYLVARYDTIALAPVLMLFALGIDGVLKQWPRWGWLLPGLLVAVASNSLLNTLGEEHVAEVLDVPGTQHLEQYVEDDDIVVAFGLRRAVTQYYLHRAGKHPTIRSFPLQVDEHPGWISMEKVMSSLPRQGATFAGELRRYVKEGRTLWVVGSPPPMDGMIDTHVQKHLGPYVTPGPRTNQQYQVWELLPKK